MATERCALLLMAGTTAFLPSLSVSLNDMLMSFGASLLNMNRIYRSLLSMNKDIPLAPSLQGHEPSFFNPQTGPVIKVLTAMYATSNDGF